MQRLLAYEASAGTGKTFALVVRYLTLLFLDVNPQSILTLTFTNKSANEMRVRIANTLKNLKDSDELDYIVKNSSLSKEEILKKQPKLYKKFLSSDIKISTIDSFFASILRKFAMYAQIDPDFTISSKEDIQETYHKFLYFSFQLNKEKNLIELSLLQEKRVKDIFSLFETLYENMVDYKIEADFRDFRRYEKEAKKSFLKIKDFILHCPKASNSAKNAVNKIQKIDDILKETWFKKESLKEYAYFKKCFEDILDSYFFDLKAALKSYILIKEAIFLENLFEIYKIFKNSKKILKRKKNALTFNDIQNFAYYILKERVDRDFLYFRLDSKIDHLLIDEFQDTSIIQYKLLEPFIEEIVAGSGQKENRTFFYVGDVKQSIYRFRGGVKELFYHTAKKFGVNTQVLNINYRSDKNIVEFVNRVFEPAYKELFGNFAIQKANSQNEGYVEVKSCEDILEELVDSVKDFLKKGVSFDDIAILCFKNDEIIEVENILKNSIENISIVTQSSSKLINQKEIVAIIEFLKYIYFKKDIFKEGFKSFFEIDEIDTKKYENIEDDLPYLVKKFLKDFNININENILRFLEVLSRYKTLGDFIFESHLIDENIPAKKQKGVKILTIHKSKGLEFKNVIVLDRLKRAKGDSSLLLFDFEGLECKRVFFKKEGKEVIDDEYKKALLKEKLYQKEDLINTLYVAFTRAKNSLTILKKDKSSVFDILNLQEIKMGEIKVEKKEKIEKIEKDIDFYEKFYGLQNKKTKNQKNITTKEIMFGNALHYTLEMMDLFDKDSLKVAIFASKNRFGKYLNEKDFLDIEKRVSNLLKNDDFQLFIKNSKLYKEIALSYKKEIRQIDLLIEKNLFNIVIDYKSSKENISEHKKQISLYKEAVEKITKKETQSFLCYLLEDKIEIIKV